MLRQPEPLNSFIENVSLMLRVFQNVLITLGVQVCMRIPGAIQHTGRVCLLSGIHVHLQLLFVYLLLQIP